MEAPKSRQFGNEFKVNRYITLKLEGNQTNIYIKGEKFRSCKYLLINLDISKIEIYEDINSIDQAKKYLDNSMEWSRSESITPREEFWGHCSNLQAWAEHDYNTNLLHSNLSFPLLKRLSELGDPTAKRVFKEEIAKRFIHGDEQIRKYLQNEGYMRYLSKKEHDTIIKEIENEKLKIIMKKGCYIEDENIYILEDDYKKEENRINERYEGSLDSILMSSHTYIYKIDYEKNILFLTNGKFEGKFLFKKYKDRIKSYKAIIKDHIYLNIYTNNAYIINSINLYDKSVYKFEKVNDWRITQVEELLKNLLFDFYFS